ncbi:MAG: DEAD/DEAH box helicase [Verrucomicrobiales bacterium]|nr:DEAD/DEAH box helicase [Verrucomicrobiales bacterium]
MSAASESDQNEPRGILTLQRINLAGRRGGRKASFAEYNQFYQQGEITKFPVGFLSFKYGDSTVENPVTDSSPARNPQREKDRYNELHSIGLDFLTKHPYSKFFGSTDLENAFCFAESDINVWARFFTLNLPEMKQRGWEVVIDDSFYFRLVTPDRWFGEVQKQDRAGTDWISFNYGIVFEGRNIGMIPVLANTLKSGSEPLDPRSLLAAAENQTIPLYVEEAGLIVDVPARHLGHIYDSFTELFEYVYGQIEVHPLRAAQLIADLGPDIFGNSELARSLAELGGSLKSDQLTKNITPPEALSATLRPYQLQGLNWLQFLRENDINGILADDMGLGKTIQTLASIQVEKSSGRMNRPALIVAPTSVLSNWVTEAGRFTPSLKILLLHGSDRENDFGSIENYDLVVTSYALLNRDIRIHRKIDYHYAILDEAQLIKNPKSQVAESACELKACHRLCLTGTPLENHLGELWSLLHFLLPGFVGRHEEFRKHWQIPIEKKNDTFRRERFISKISPLFLRRTRDDVLKELPPRTDIVHEIILDQGQTTLYESVRSKMDQKVRDALKEKGLGRSHLVVLDGLLKLRQICCDPRLLNTAAARKLKKSAKLEAFEELVSKQVEAGRRILVFSQFTSMISLLEESLDKMDIGYVTLTGSTTKRKEVIEQFQTSEVPVFLISLKAGGFGLNLTAADCVIHYDPWWNPAVEEQATARAHRMGQDKPVFVYRLVAKGSIEERILELQERKADLAAAVLSGEETTSLDTLTQNEVERLFAPLSD